MLNDIIKQHSHFIIIVKPFKYKNNNPKKINTMNMQQDSLWPNSTYENATWEI